MKKTHKRIMNLSCFQELKLCCLHLSEQISSMNRIQKEQIIRNKVRLIPM